jgi:DNA-binding SARP family transcriptional activator
MTASLELQVGDLAKCRQTIIRLLADLPAAGRPMVPSNEKARWLFYCFGPFEVFRAEDRIPLRRAGKGHAILKYLAAGRGQVVLRDVLLDSLWPETEPLVANNRLKVAMHHLRQAFAFRDDAHESGEIVIFQNGGYRLNPELDIWSDVEAFEAHWQAGMLLERTGRLAEAVHFYMQAEALYRGDFLEEDRLEEWTLVRREALKDTFLTILDKLSRFWFKTNHVERAIEGWKKILTKDPWREDAYRHLMICFVSRGQRALALHWYDVCVQVVHRQLGLEPEPETQRLSERIRSGKRIEAESEL